MNQQKNLKEKMSLRSIIPSFFSLDSICTQTQRNLRTNEAGSFQAFYILLGGKNNVFVQETAQHN